MQYPFAMVQDNREGEVTGSKKKKKQNWETFLSFSMVPLSLLHMQVA